MRVLDKDRIYDLVGVGFGPSNVALAVALEEELGREDMSSRCIFFEKQGSSAWHPGMMLPGSTLQVPFIKDLVTLRNPTSSYTFLNYLKMRGRLDEFANLRTFYPSRQEFADYIQWVADQFQLISRYSSAVQKVTPLKDGIGRVTSLVVETDSGEAYQTSNLVVATGGEVYVPAEFEGVVGPLVFHSKDYLRCLPAPGDLKGAVVVVVGSGQSAAEIVHHLAEQTEDVEIVSLMRDFALRPTDDSKFVNEVFLPRNVAFTYSLPHTARRKFLESMHSLNYSTADMGLIDNLYRLIYDSKVIGKPKIRFIGHADIEGATSTQGGVELRWRNGITGETDKINADYVVLATGFTHERLPAAFAPINEFVLHQEGRMLLEHDYRLACREDFEPAIYLQGGFAEHSHGVAEPVLSFTAHRAGIITRSLIERFHRSTEQEVVDKNFLRDLALDTR